MNSDVVGRPIVVGLDASESARQAARWAADEAVRGHLPLKLVGAVHMPTPSYFGAVAIDVDFTGELAAETEHRLAEAQAGLAADHPEVDISTGVMAGLAIPALIEESKTARLLVLGSRGLGGFSGLVVGSTATALVAHGHCPIVVVRGTPQGGPVVVGVDGSPASEAAVAIAFEEASERGAELVAVHTWTEYTADGAYAAAHQFVVDWALVETQQQEELAERLAGWQEKYPDVRVRRVVTRDRPVRCLLNETTDAQLLVVGSRGHGGFTGMLLGSTSQALVYHANCPLLVARPPA